jgi:hypothetical protein
MKNVDLSSVDPTKPHTDLNIGSFFYDRSELQNSLFFIKSRVRREDEFQSVDRARQSPPFETAKVDLHFKSFNLKEKRFSKAQRTRKLRTVTDFSQDLVLELSIGSPRYVQDSLIISRITA